MSKEEVLRRVDKGYRNDWIDAPPISQVVRDIKKLYRFPKDSKEYFMLKAHVITGLSMNCIDQFDKGEAEQAGVSREILETLITSLDSEEKVLK